ncbi:apolipoprotein N-acyltransferase [Dongia sp.]|uniref:apolipoprotein N-acyltransferase n=1 Tax=Dongia sp. TaxID=1977262 RepID=UPI0035AE9271
MQMMARLYARVEALAGWRRRGFAVLLGALSALGFAPVHAVPVFAVSLIGLYWLIQSAPTRRMAFNIAWFWSFGHFAAGNFWIANSFLLDIVRFGWMMPPVIAGLAAYLALYPALAGALAWRKGDLSPGRIVAFAGLWLVTEWLRSHVLTGYAWNLAAYVWDVSPAMMQSAALWGSWGLSLLTVAIFTLPAALATPPLAGAKQRAAVFGTVGAALALVLLFAGGAWRLAGDSGEHVPGVTLRIVQANVSQIEKLKGGFSAQHFEKHMRLTRETPGLEKVTHVIWPESAIPFLLDRQPELRQIIASIVPAKGALIAGTIRGAPSIGELSQIWNSLVVITPNGEVSASADKAHLVPLGEYVPMRSLFPFISKLTPGSMDFSAAPGPTTIAVPGAPSIGPSICYEVIFPGAVVDETQRPDWLVNITNDGWFGNSPGPYQHFTSARFRAVEEGIPLVRAANTGISGVIDAYGRIEVETKLGESAVIDVALPKAQEQPTIFASNGIWIPLLLVAIALIPIVARRRSA